MSIRFQLCVALCLSLSACTLPSTKKELEDKVIEQKAQQLTYGMTKQNVLNIMGSPYKKKANAEGERYFYKHSRCWIIVFDKNGKLVASQQSYSSCTYTA